MGVELRIIIANEVESGRDTTHCNPQRQVLKQRERWRLILRTPSPTRDAKVHFPPTMPKFARIIPLADSASSRRKSATPGRE